jgi:hypothetical protein
MASLDCRKHHADHSDEMVKRAAIMEVSLADNGNPRECRSGLCIIRNPRFLDRSAKMPASPPPPRLLVFVLISHEVA